jgi:hypothetical protein
MTEDSFPSNVIGQQRGEGDSWVIVIVYNSEK